ncbi:hypothetical protein H310_11551 [Aphanomyces invadans]|uniref:N-acetyltransferase domain-containing protein n=1 Tax=Aphanomyces invadans TaxID=157072 RepID=A0A024TLA6_9STRA|nr:hypothetical protein H310_11551 [Aphanomyces invadans]ETV94900.1 hypothetical protein H310_11551 [Aphanomyces invadans]RHY30466.1 hypothetical protein DYB32_004310 [Aphanomyces invadans]|eukprot:XP_008876491.1 hypothetical protein H310_11551 [Aphanomyces invadans]
MTMDAREIVHGSRAFEAAILLREEVLRKPLGMVLDRNAVATEATDIHIGVYSDDELVAYALLRPAHPIAWMKQVAVSPAVQGKGLGRSLIEAFEARAIKEGFHSIHLHARETAVGFYLKLGYAPVDNDTFMQVGIPHRHMFKTIICDLTRI